MFSFFAPIILVAAAQADAGTATVAARSQRQQAFDAASGAAASGRCDEAVKGFEALQGNTSVRPNPVVDAIINIRKGGCLITLARPDEAEVALRAGLAVIASRQADLKGDIYQAHMALGRIALARLDYATVEAETLKALALANGIERFEPLLRLARITMFDGDDRALAYAAEAVSLVEKEQSKDKELLAAVRTTHARALLNRGRYKEAYAELRSALAMQGGLVLRVGVTDLVTRSDLALAALLAGDEEAGRKFLAYTGAGRMKDSPFSRAVSMETPFCAGDAGLRPQDSTIVEFSLDADGAVVRTTPIYSTGDRRVALMFAQAVMEWSWKPEDAKTIPDLFRAVTRVELRCSTAGQRPGVMSVLEAGMERWMQSAGAQPIAEDTTGRMAVAARATLARLPADASGIARLPALIELGQNPIFVDEERTAFLAEAVRIVRRAGAPIAVQTYVNLLELDAGSNLRGSAQAKPARLRALLADPAVAGDAPAAATVRLLLAQGEYRVRAPADAPALLAAVVADTRLPADDPLKINALLQQASLASAAGDLQAARSKFTQTGLDEAQCALIGAEPVVKRAGGSSADYPVDALQMGFQGWVRVEFDILADGKPTAVRPVIAYPPFIFNRGATAVVDDARYQASYRPSGGTACTGSRRNIVFRLPS